ncbi:hypothetical protein ACLZX5_03725 [Enterococcus faecium]
MLKKVLRFGVCISIWLVTSSTCVPSMIAVADSVAIQETIASDSEGKRSLQNARTMHLMDKLKRLKYRKQKLLKRRYRAVQMN